MSNSPSIENIIELIVFIVALIVLAPVIGKYMYTVFTGEKHIFKRILGRAERLIYRLCGIDENTGMDWKQYLFALIIFNAAGLIVLFVLQVFQNFLPLNPEQFPSVSWHAAFNTAVSFVTNTNWQSYGSENTLSYLVQMSGLTVQNFLSAATGITVLLALSRSLGGKTSLRLGNFWVDLTRSVLYVLLPLSFLFALFLVSQGVIQNFNEYVHAVTPEGTEQVIPMGPAASQIAIKQLGTNGGGFFNTNSAHPFENPSPLSNLAEVFSIIILSAGLVFTYGHFINSSRQAWTIFIVMMIMFISSLALSLWAEYSFAIPGGMEGKETRFGVFDSILWSITTTVTSNGSVNSMHDSLSPISGMLAMFNIMLGEVVFGGVGSGLYGMIIFIILTVFIAGLMVGRTPEYLGKKIDAFEIKMAILAVLAPNIVIKLFSALAVSVDAGLAGLNNAGPHGLSEILYAFSSAAGNNGSAFAGLTSNTVFYNLLLGFGMLIGRYGIIIPVLAIAGNMVSKKITPLSTGTFRTDNWLFMLLLIGVILIVGGLTFFPPLALGPLAEHFLIQMGITF